MAIHTTQHKCSLLKRKPFFFSLLWLGKSHLYFSQNPNILIVIFMHNNIEFQAKIDAFGVMAFAWSLLLSFFHFLSFSPSFFLTHPWECIFIHENQPKCLSVFIFFFNEAYYEHTLPSYKFTHWLRPIRET